MDSTKKHKSFIYDLTQFKGYKLICEKSKFEIYRKLEYQGLEILDYYHTVEGKTIYFTISLKLLRKLKLLQVSDSVIPESIEYNLLCLIDDSKEVEDHFLPFYSYGDAFYYYKNYDYEFDIRLEEKRERRTFINRSSRNNNQKIRQYENKSRFRK